MNQIDLTNMDHKTLNHLTIVVSKDQISRDIDGETVILNMKTGVYFGLNETGARIWQLIQQPIKIQEVIDRLADEYDVEPERCGKDIVATLNQMVINDLIKVNDF
jgi:hypothetical protein